MRNPSKNTIKRAVRTFKVGNLTYAHVRYMVWLMSKEKIDPRTGKGTHRYKTKI